MENDQITNLLTGILILFIAILFILVVVYIFLSISARRRRKKIENIKNEVKLPTDSKKESEKSLNIDSILKFMEFEDVKDNMIIQKKGYKYLMVVECQGVNYDLMSEVEKTAVEEGFIQFLNTLRHSVQIYVQTRSINLEKSLELYNGKVKEIEDKYLYMENEYQNMLESRQYNDEQIQKYFFELTKITNLYEYGKDVIEDTQKMSLNRNILNRTYYIIVPYYPSELGNNEFDVEEIQNIAFSELYTRCQSIIRTLTACSINGKILASNNLIDLLYMAYNRDGAESFGIGRALLAEYDQLYSTAPDILEKKMTALNKKIEELAVEKAKNSLKDAKKEIEKEIQEKQNRMDELIDQMAKIILEENKDYVGDQVAEKAIDNIEKEISKKGEENDVQKGERRSSAKSK